jgi:hypothetical protein
LAGSRPAWRGQPELLSDPAYHDEEAARAYIKAIRWADGPFCPFCGSLETLKPLGGPSMGRGWYYCASSRPFTKPLAQPVLFRSPPRPYSASSDTIN